MLANENTPLLVFHVFRLFTACLNCRAFWLLSLVYRLSKLTKFAFIGSAWLERIETNSTTLYDPRIRSKPVHPWASAEIFPERKCRNFTYPFKVAEDAEQIYVHKMFYPFYPISLCWWNLSSQSLFEMFSALQLSELNLNNKDVFPQVCIGPTTSHKSAYFNKPHIFILCEMKPA